MVAGPASSRILGLEVAIPRLLEHFAGHLGQVRPLHALVLDLALQFGRAAVEPSLSGHRRHGLIVARPRHPASLAPIAALRASLGLAPKCPKALHINTGRRYSSLGR